MTSRLVASLLVILAWAPATGQEVRVPSSAGEIRRSYGPVVKRVAPAVVNVYAARVAERRLPMFADQIKVSLADKREFGADIVLKDQHSDLAVLRLKDTRGRFAAIDLGDSAALAVGDIVLALGNP